MSRLDVLTRQDEMHLSLSMYRCAVAEECRQVTVEMQGAMAGVKIYPVAAPATQEEASNYDRPKKGRGGSWRDEFESTLGMLSVSIWSFMFYLIPLYFIFCLMHIFRDGFTTMSLFYSLPIVLSAIAPPIRGENIFASYAMRCTGKYFNYKEFSEMNDDDLKQYANNTKPCFLAAYPHGVIPFTALSALTHGDKNRISRVLDELPIGTVAACCRAPILKHMFGLFGAVEATKAVLAKRFREMKNCMIFPGGIAELFLSDRDQEVIYIKKRKSFIELAIVEGGDVVPVYLFGNTNALRLVKHPLLEWLSRKYKFSCVLMYGRWGLPIPFRGTYVMARGPPLRLPQDDNPSQELVDKWHAVYMGEIVRLFNTYKIHSPEYRNKELILT